MPSQFKVLPTFYKLPRMLQFATVGGSVFGIGFLMLAMLVDKFGWTETSANALQLTVTFMLNFILNRKLTWYDRDVSYLAMARFLVSRVATSTAIGYWLFEQLVTNGVHYLVANIACVGLATVANFIASDRWVFADRAIPAHSVHSLWFYRGRNLIVVIVAMLAIYTWQPSNVLATVLTIVAIVTCCFATFEVARVVYAYRRPEVVDQIQFPEPKEPVERIALIVPARHEQEVLRQTLTHLAQQTHPNFLIMATVCSDDHETLAEANAAATQYPDRISVLSYTRPAGVNPSKPLQLNYALAALAHENVSVVGVIDAEDTVSPDLLRHIDTAFRDPEVHIVQGGVQLMNYRDHWYSVHNCLEYWKWFSSVMRFQADQNFVPLGGNTVFVRYELLERAGGWPLSLTEDCALGVHLSVKFGAKVVTHYQPDLATQEETPATLGALIKQRVRWYQGFYAEVRKGVWRQLPTLRQRMMAMYILGNPLYQAFLTLLVPVTLATMIVLRSPVLMVMAMYLPLVPMFLQIVLNALYLYDFSHAFGLKVKIWTYLNLLLTHFAYQFILNVAGFWAMARELRGNHTWYTTPHVGSHRTQLQQVQLQEGM